MPKHISALDGPPGSGKTTKLVADFSSWPQPACILTFGKDAAKTLVSRGIPPESAKTLYSACWPHVREVSDLKIKRGKSTTPTYRRRAVQHSGDTALSQYVKSAPSLQPKNTRAERIHAWEPSQGDPPEWIWGEDISRDESFAVGLARWLARGAPLKDFDGYQYIAIDEAQDLSMLEVAACLALVKEGGQCLMVGDPGQAIFIGNKGWPNDRLPPAWEVADEVFVLEQGFRVGYPASDAAAGVLSPFWDRPASTFRAAHMTQMHPWHTAPPSGGLILGLSRWTVDNYIAKNDLRNVGVIPGLTPEGLTCCTIHAAKGSEADDVYILPWSEKRLFLLDKGDPNELRLLYVALTRAKQRLHLPPELLIRANHAISRARS